MGGIAIERVDGIPTEANTVSRELAALAEQIRECAFTRFEKRGGADGHALEDWLEAERELMLTPPWELVVQDNKYQLKMAAPGFDARDLHLTASPTMLLVRGQSAHHRHPKDGEVRFCDFEHKNIFRRWEWPASVDVDSVRAKLANGILQVTATRGDRAEEQGS